MIILLVEDDIDIGAGLESSLNSSGFSVDWATDGESAQALLPNQFYDCILLDIGLPGKSGLDWLREWRGQKRREPIIILTALDETWTRTAAMDGGADDYLVKPVAFETLISRIRAAILQLATQPSPSIQRHGRLAYDAMSRQPTWNDAAIVLSDNERALLEVFLKHSGKVMSTSEIICRMQNGNRSTDSDELDVLVRNLCQKTSPDFIKTFRGIGYALVEA